MLVLCHNMQIPCYVIIRPITLWCFILSHTLSYSFMLCSALSNVIQWHLLISGYRLVLQDYGTVDRNGTLVNCNSNSSNNNNNNRVLCVCVCVCAYIYYVSPWHSVLHLLILWSTPPIQTRNARTHTYPFVHRSSPSPHTYTYNITHTHARARAHTHTHTHTEWDRERWPLIHTYTKRVTS